MLQPGETRNVPVRVDAGDSAHPLSYWDTTTNTWQVAGGDYTVYVGNSSRNLAVAGTFHVVP
jgi:beta-glucosidase